MENTNKPAKYLPLTIGRIRYTLKYSIFPHRAGIVSFWLIVAENKIL